MTTFKEKLRSVKVSGKKGTIIVWVALGLVAVNAIVSIVTSIINL